MTVKNFDQTKADFLPGIATTLTMEEIPAELIFNWDQTGLNLVPASNWTMEIRGSRQVEVAEPCSNFYCKYLWPHAAVF